MKKIINSENAPSPIGPYNQAILSQGFLYTSGQIAINPETGLTEFENIESETKLVMQNLKAILKAAEFSFENVIKVSIFISDMNNFSKINEVYASYFNEEDAPARETVQVAKLPKNANVEISLIAVENI
ncbi:MAG: Rid family detoxifying hydrolase [Psychroflexus sp.]